MIREDKYTPIENQPRTDAEKRLVAKIQIGVFVVIIASLPAFVNMPVILNYPVWLIFAVAGGVFFFALIILYRYNQRPTLALGSGGMSIFLLAIIALVPTIMLTFVIHIFISYYIIQESKKNTIEQVRCEITGLTGQEKKRRKRDGSGVYFAFKGDTLHMKISFNVVKGIRKDNLFRESLMVVNVRKGPFDCYVVEKWKVVRK